DAGIHKRDYDFTNAGINFRNSENHNNDTRDSESQRHLEHSILSSRNFSDRPLHPDKVILDSKIEDELGRSCTTHDGHTGICDHLVNCPQIKLNLNPSICFKNLLPIGVCCSKSSQAP
ncbi:hypothetical protein L9F63_009857, partial [Diploptera punctata]